MEAKKFEEGEEKRLKTEQTRLRTHLKCFHNELLADPSELEFEDIKQCFNRLCEIHRLFISHLLAIDGDLELEEEAHEKYVQMMRDITEHFQPKSSSSKSVDFSLPKVDNSDPNSWINFMEKLDLLATCRDISSVSKRTLVINALPHSLACKLGGKSFEEMVQFVKEYFQSSDAMRKIIRKEFRRLYRFDDLKDFKKLSSVLDRLLDLTSDEKMLDLIFKLTITRNFKSEIINQYVCSQQPLDIEHINKYIKHCIKAKEIRDAAKRDLKLENLDSSSDDDSPFLEYHELEPKAELPVKSESESDSDLDVAINKSNVKLKWPVL